jgi:type VI secretion system protein ImpL
MIWITAATLILFALAVAVLFFVASKSRVTGTELARAGEAQTFDPRGPKRFFQRVTGELKARVRGLDPRYDVPWVALIGPPGSGKSAISAAGNPGSSEPADGLTSHFFAGGVVVEIRGAVGFPGIEGGSLEQWRATISRLKQERPRRPLDGVTVALPVTLFVDESSANFRESVAAMLRARLLELQAELGFLLPVYVVITKTDLVPGFDAFVQALPEAQKQNLLGWSSPYRPDLPCDPAWIDEAFADTYRSLIHLQMEMYADAAPPSDPHHFFLFPPELLRLRTRVRQLLERAFQPSAYDPHPIFRGLYFSGEEPGGEGRLLFIRDLFEEKVFAERGLGVPLHETLTARNRQSRWAQAVAIALALGISFGLWREAQRLRGMAASHRQFFDKLKTAAHARAGHSSNDPRIRLDTGYRLAQSMSQLRSPGFQSPMLPASYLFPVTGEIAQLFKKAFSLVLSDFGTALLARGRSLGEDGAVSGGAAERLEDAPAYRALEAFGEQYRRFAENLGHYNALVRSDTGTLDEFGRLATYLTDGSGYAPLQIPEEPYGTALRSAEAPDLDCGSLPLQRRAAEAAGAFRASWFSEDHPLDLAMNEFVDTWRPIARRQGGDVEKLKASLDHLERVTANMRWVGGRFDVRRYPALSKAPFTPDPADAGACAVGIAGELAAIESAHEALRTRLLERTDPDLGAILTADPLDLSLGERTALIKRSLDEVASLGLLPTGQPDERSDGGAWDPAAVEEALSTVDRFEAFRLSALPQSLENVLRSAIRNDLAARVWSANGGNPASRETDFPAVLERFRKSGDTLRRSPAGQSVYGAVVREAERSFQEANRRAAERFPDIFGSASSTGLARRAVDEWYGSRLSGDRTSRWAEFVETEKQALVTVVRGQAAVVNFLSSVRPNAPSLRLWREIEAEVAAYEAKTPANGIAFLETAMRNDIPSITPDRNCPDVPPAIPARGQFALVRASLIRQARDRCRETAISDVRPRYERIAKAFDSYLRGHFPYPAAGETGRPDARAADVTAFYRVYLGENGPALAAELSTQTCQAPLAAFLRHFDTMRGFFAPSAEQGLPLPIADATVDFRIHREAETAGSHIADWVFSTGGQELHLGQPPRVLRWQGGGPVAFRFRIAKDSVLTPTPAPGLSVNGKQVEFAYQGPWSIWNAIERQRAGESDLPTLRDDEPYSLLFRIPVSGDPAIPEIRVFVRLRVLAAGKKDEIRVIGFPGSAPAWTACGGSS